MYEQYFHFRQAPFSIAPDPGFLFLSQSHREAMAHLEYGLSNGGFVLITGEVGTGKTTLLRNLLQRTPPDLDVAFILNPRLTVRELLESLCDELGVAYDKASTGTVKQYIDVLNRHLLKTHQSGRSTVAIIDEAQNLSPAVLEQVRLLTNLETNERKLLRIILLGQPELAELLARQELRQLAQRITARYHLGTLDRHECAAYVRHRLAHAGGDPDLFTAAAIRRLYALSGGVPRLVNAIADRALLGAYAESRRRVSARIVSRAAREVLGRSPDARHWLLAGAAAAAIAGAAWAVYLLPGAEPDRADLSAPVADSVTSAPPVGGAERATAPAQQAPAAATPVDANDASTLAVPPDVPLTSAAPPDVPLTSAAPPDAPATSVVDAGTPAGAVGVPEIIPERAIVRPSENAFALRRQAFRAVFARWGIDLADAPDAQIPCDFAPSAGLQCLSQRGDWSEIERLDLPVVLELWDDQDAPYYAALTGMRDGSITLDLAGQEMQTTQRALRDLWYGAYVVLWRTPPGYYGSLRAGDMHSTVGWLRSQLEALALTPAAGQTPNLFDAELRDAVLTFQQQEGLVTDGVVGPATWIRLADRLQLPAPSLAG